MIVVENVWNRQDKPEQPWVKIGGYKVMYGENSAVGWNLILKAEGGMDVYIRKITITT